MRYSVICEPPLSGADQSTTTLSELIEVVGVDGYAGTCAARIVKSRVNGPKPTELRA